MPGGSGVEAGFIWRLGKMRRGDRAAGMPPSTAGKDACRHMNRRLRLGFQLFLECRYALGIARGRGKLSLDQTIDHYPYENFF
jgi:hypothetical protein